MQSVGESQIQHALHLLSPCHGDAHSCQMHTTSVAVVHAAEVWTPRMTTQNAPSVMLWCPHFVRFVLVLDGMWCPTRCSMAVVAAVTAAVSAMRATNWTELGRPRGEAGPIRLAIAPSASANCSVKLVLACGKVERVLFTRCRRAPSDPRGGAGAVRNTRTEALRASHKGAMDARQAAVHVHTLAAQVHA